MWEVTCTGRRNLLPSPMRPGQASPNDPRAVADRPLSPVFPGMARDHLLCEITLHLTALNQGIER